MRSISIIFVTILCLLMPMKANAGFILGLSMGRGGQGPISSDIPQICLIKKTKEEYAKCRTPSALQIRWVIKEYPGFPHNVDWYKENCILLSDFIDQEWEYIQETRKQK